MQLLTITGNSVTTQDIAGCGNGAFFSIAALGSKLYYNSLTGELYSADITYGSMPAISNCKLLGTGIYTNGLTVDTNGILYYANGNLLYAFDPANAGAIYLGTMPYQSGGDLTFYHNQLFMASNNGIVSVKINDPSKSTIYIGQNAYFYGLTTLIINGVSTVYGGSNDQLIEIDMQNRVVKGSLDTITPSYDLASPTEAGVVSKVNVDSIKITQECNAYNMSQVRVFDKPDSSQHTFIINNAQTNTTGIFNDLPPGNYHLTVRSSLNELQKDTSFVIPDYTSSYPAIKVSQVNPACFTTGDITLDAGSVDSLYTVRYQNNNYPLGHKFAGLTAGLYNFSVLNKQGCIVGEKAITLSLDCPITIDSAQVMQECDTLNRGSVKIVTKPHPNQYTYTLNTGQADTTGIFNYLLPGKYQCTVTSVNNQAPASINFTVNDFTVYNLAITAVLHNLTCGSQGQIKLDAGNADSLYHVRFGNDVFNFDHIYTGLAQGNYHFTILNKNGCIIDEKAYTLKQQVCPPIVVNSLSIDQQCDAYNQAEVKIICKADSTQHTFTLNTGQTDTTGIFNNLAPGNYKLSIISNGNRAPKDTAFNVPDFTINNPAITFIAKDPICTLPGHLKLDAGAVGRQYTIKYGNDIFGFDHVFNDLTAGSYHFTILNLKGCIIEEKDYTLQQDDCPLIIIDSVKIAAECSVYGQGVVTVYTQAHNAAYTYNLNNVTNTTGIFDFLTPGIYQLTIISSNGNTLTKDVTVPDFTLNKPAVTYKIKDPVCELPGEIIFSIAGNISGIVIRHLTNTYTIDQTIGGLAAGSNAFSFFNAQGCIIDTLNVNVLQDECNPVAFPNTFTPNGDGINEIFRPNQNANPETFKLAVFNRWGSLLFQSQSILNGWDGNFNGKPVPIGVYYWVANYTSPDNKKHTISGYVTLIR